RRRAAPPDPRAAASPAAHCGAPHRWLFFFSSRRRHTRSKRDWSSDVCSSDLLFEYIKMPRSARMIYSKRSSPNTTDSTQKTRTEIGRASCRERVASKEVAMALISKTAETDGARRGGADGCDGLGWPIRSAGA